MVDPQRQKERKEERRKKNTRSFLTEDVFVRLALFFKL